MAQSPSGFSLSIIFSVPDQSVRNEMVSTCQIPYIYDYTAGTQLYNIGTYHPEHDGCWVNMVY